VPLPQGASSARPRACHRRQRENRLTDYACTPPRRRRGADRGERPCGPTRIGVASPHPFRGPRAIRASGPKVGGSWTSGAGPSLRAGHDRPHLFAGTDVFYRCTVCGHVWTQPRRQDDW